VLLLLAEGEWGRLGTVLGLLSIPLLVGLNAFFVAAEFALVAVRKTRVEELVKHNVAGARSVAAAIEHMNRTIAATQLGVTLSSLGLGWVAESILAQALTDLCANLPAPWNFIARHSIAGAAASPEPHLPQAFESAFPAVACTASTMCFAEIP